MSFDLAIWRRSPTTKTAMLAEVYEALGQHDHPAAAMFDAAELVEAAAARYGTTETPDQAATWIQVSLTTGELVAVALEPWTGDTTAVVEVSGPYDALGATIGALLPLVVERNLMLYDPQAQAVYNNRRQYPGGGLTISER